MQINFVPLSFFELFSVCFGGASVFLALRNSLQIVFSCMDNAVKWVSETLVLPTMSDPGSPGLC